MRMGGGQAQNKMLNIGYFADGIWSHNAFKIIANQICKFVLYVLGVAQMIKF